MQGMEKSICYCANGNGACYGNKVTQMKSIVKLIFSILKKVFLPLFAVRVNSFSMLQFHTMQHRGRGYGIFAPSPAANMDKSLHLYHTFSPSYLYPLFPVFSTVLHFYSITKPIKIIQIQFV